VQTLEGLEEPARLRHVEAFAVISREVLGSRGGRRPAERDVRAGPLGGVLPGVAGQILQDHSKEPCVPSRRDTSATWMSTVRPGEVLGLVADRRAAAGGRCGRQVHEGPFEIRDAWWLRDVSAPTTLS
jgi:hypothetical protein